MSEAYVDENMDCRPAPGAQFNPNANISPEEGFLLSQADGQYTIREILQVLPFPKDHVGRMLINLRRSGMLDWEGGTEPPSETVDASPPEDDILDDSFEEFEPLDEPDELDDDFGMAGMGDDTAAEPTESPEPAATSGAGDEFGFSPEPPPENEPTETDGTDVAALLEEIETEQAAEPVPEEDPVTDEAIDEPEPTESLDDIDDQTLSQLDALMEDIDDLDDDSHVPEEEGLTLDESGESDDISEITEDDSQLFDEIGAHDEDFDDVIAELEATDVDQDSEPTGASKIEAEPEPETENTPPAPRAPRKPNMGEKKVDAAAELTQLRTQIDLQEKMLRRKDPFQALGVKGGSSDKEIRDAWHRLSRKFHPDRYYHLELPDEIATRLEDLFTQLQQAYDSIASREARRAYMLSLRDARMSESRAKQDEAGESDDADDGRSAGKSGLDAEQLADLAEEALAHGQYKSAKLNFQMAAQISQNKTYKERAKLVDLVQAVEGRIVKILESTDPPYIDDVKSVTETIVKIEPILPQTAPLLKRLSLFLCEHSDDSKLARRVVERLLKCNRLPDTLILAARIYLRGDLPQTALDLLEDAKQRDPGNSEIKNLIKEAKRSLKK